MNQQAQDDIIAKIQKLLALANSDNEHEAQIAAQRAQELMVKHNLEMQQIKVDLEYAEQVVANDLPYALWHHNYILNICKDYFFVRTWFAPQKYKLTRDNRRQFRYGIVFFGTKANVKIANYVFDYLCGAYQRLWLDYKRANGLTEKSRKSYYSGLSKGLRSKLEETRARVEQDRGLVLVNDPKLDARMAKGFTSHGGSYNPEYHHDVAMAGIEHGKSISIAKPIEGQRIYTGIRLNGRKG